MGYRRRPPVDENGTAVEPFSQMTLQEFVVDRKLSTREKKLNAIGNTVHFSRELA
jgi:hypothetical protein